MNHDGMAEAQALEDEIDKPVVTSHTATLWASSVRPERLSNCWVMAVSWPKPARTFAENYHPKITI
jgi:hypothetical protein